MADEGSDAALEAAADRGAKEAEAVFAAAESAGNWANWRGPDPSAAPWWDAGAEWVWTVLQAGGFWGTLTLANYRREIRQAADMLSLGVFERLLKPYQDRVFGPHAPDMKDAFANYVFVGLLPRVTARVLGPGEAKPVERALMPDDRDRETLANEFVSRCNDELPFKVLRKHIWMAAKHKTGRQFQYWQKDDARATAKDGENFRRILAMSPKEFHALLLQLRLDGVPLANVR